MLVGAVEEAARIEGDGRGREGGREGKKQVEDSLVKPPLKD